MLNIFEEIKSEIPSKDLSCFIVFGSSVVNNNTGRNPEDIDVCIVVKDSKADMKAITAYLFSKFKKPDFRIYTEGEINSNLNFIDVGVGVFAMEYFANGVSLYGENIFEEKVKEIDPEALKQSYLNKIFEYILRIRVAYLSPAIDPEYKKRHIDKYVLRLCIDILLYRGHIKYSDLKDLSKDEIYNLCKEKGIVNKYREIKYDDLDDMYALFEEVNKNVVDFHTEVKERPSDKIPGPTIR